MKIYFIRHGEAESYCENDFSRKLTTSGRIKLHKTFSTFFKTIEDVENYKIYSSPLDRACETAEILTVYLNKNFEIKNYLAKTNLNEVLKDLDSDNNYILIGHEPSISMWIKELTGENVIVSRGSIHLVKLDFESKKGKLLKITN